MKKLILLLSFLVSTNLLAHNLDQMNYGKYAQMIQDPNQQVDVWGYIEYLRAKVSNPGQGSIGLNIENRVNRIKTLVSEGLSNYLSHVSQYGGLGMRYQLVTEDNQFFDRSLFPSIFYTFSKGVLSHDPRHFNLPANSSIKSITFQTPGCIGLDSKMNEIKDVLDDLKNSTTSFDSTVLRAHNALIPFNSGCSYRMQKIIFARAYREFVNFQDFLRVLEGLGTNTRHYLR